MRRIYILALTMMALATPALARNAYTKTDGSRTAAQSYALGCMSPQDYARYKRTGSSGQRNRNDHHGDGHQSPRRDPVNHHCDRHPIVIEHRYPDYHPVTEHPFYLDPEDDFRTVDDSFKLGCMSPEDYAYWKEYGSQPNYGYYPEYRPHPIIVATPDPDRWRKCICRDDGHEYRHTRGTWMWMDAHKHHHEYHGELTRTEWALIATFLTVLAVRANAHEAPKCAAPVTAPVMAPVTPAETPSWQTAPAPGSQPLPRTEVSLEEVE